MKTKLLVAGLAALGIAQISAGEENRVPFTPYDSEGYLDPAIKASWNGAYTCPGHVHFTVTALGAGLYPAAVALKYLNVVQWDHLDVTPFADDNCLVWIRGTWERTTGTWPDIRNFTFVVTLAEWGRYTQYQWLEIPWHEDLRDRITPACDPNTDRLYEVNLGSHYVNVGCGAIPRPSPTPRPRP
jgi:hypothetical protein